MTDCVLTHLVISREYDVYRSYSHPRRALSPQCRRYSNSQQEFSSSSSRTVQRCRRRWYLGVDGRGRVRTIKTARRPPPMKAFFFKKWLHIRIPPTPKPLFNYTYRIPHPFTPTTTPSPTTTAVGERRARKNERRKGSRLGFSLLRYGRRRNGSRPTRVEDSDETTTSGVDNEECGLNLLSSCGRRRNSSKERSSRNGRRQPNVVRHHGGRRRGSELLRP